MLVGGVNLFFMKRKIFLFLAIVSVVGMIAISGCGKEKVYRVSFDANGGTGEMKQQAFAKDRPQSLISNAFTHIGYLFDGWNTVSDGSGEAYTEAQEIVLDEDITLYAQWKAHEWVDLGLPSGTKWATYNVGATKPEEFGDYFAWGETTPKSDYTYGTYKYCTADYDSESNSFINIFFSKYNFNSSYGIVDDKTVLDMEDDAAMINWGDNWRMPTYGELYELKTECSWILTINGGVNGYLLTGPNGNSIFLPTAGCKNGTSLYVESFKYWSNTRAGYYVFCLDFEDEYINYSQRFLGSTVRAVRQ